MFTTLITTHELSENLNRPDWVIIDCRFNLANPDWGFEDYQAGHVPGAVYAHLDKDLAGKTSPTTGRHPLPDIHEFICRLSTWGITPTSQVVLYDTAGGSLAVRLWFMLRLIGHQAVCVLDGSFTKWKKENLPIRSGIETNPMRVYPDPAKIHLEWIVSADEIDDVQNNPENVLLDARAPERFRGDIEPIDFVAGHIPGAINRFHGLNLTEEGTFKAPQNLRHEFLQLLGNKSPGNAVVYCGSGVTSCHHLLSMEVAGLPQPRIYIGSWSEWIRDPQHPIAKG